MALDLAALQKKQQERGKGSGGGSFYSLEDGDNVLRILPRSLDYFKKGDADFTYVTYVHFNMFDVSGYSRIPCAQAVGKVCPICDYVRSIPGKTEEKGALYARERHLFNVFVYADNSVRRLETGPSIYDDILKFVLNPSWGDLFGIKDGRDIVITKIPAEKSTTGWISYSVIPKPDRTDISSLLPEGWDSQVVGLVDALPEVPSENELVRLLDCYKRRISPAQDENSQGNVSKVQPGAPVLRAGPVQRVAPAVSPAVEVKVPQCFGQDYSPKMDRCVQCAVRVQCKQEFMKL